MPLLPAKKKSLRRNSLKWQLRQASEPIHRQAVTRLTATPPLTPPNERRHPPRHRLPPIGKKQRLLLVCIKATTIEMANTYLAQFNGC